MHVGKGTAGGLRSVGVAGPLSPLLVDSGHLPFHVVSSHALSSWVAGLPAHDGLGVQKRAHMEAARPS